MKHLSISYSIVTLNELNEKEQMLFHTAEASLKNAHAPYSHFYVASALIDTNGKITSGNNQENAAYPSGLCAERVALFAAKSQSRVPISAIIVLAQNERNEKADAFPCGSCRQVMMEYAMNQQTPIKIIMQRKDGDFITIEDATLLLPFHFDSEKLK